MTEATYCDQLGHRSRAAFCLVVGPGDQVALFGGHSIPGKLVVVGGDYQKAGKWSASTYRIELAPGVRLVSGHLGWEQGTLREALAANRWTEVASAIGVSLPVAQALVREWRPREAAHLDAVEAQLAELDEIAPAGATEVSISFGGPTRRMREAGYWGWPVVVELAGRVIARITQDAQRRWTSDSDLVRVLDVQHSSGHGGGYTSLRLAVPDGATAEHRQIDGM